MGKRVMIICGSPNRDGKTNRLVRWVADAVREAGAEVEIADAAHLEYKTNGCTACMACQESEEYGCVIEDAASPIIRRMADADAVVFATPVYWHGPTAQLKLILDRTFSLVKVRTDPFETALKGTTLGLIATAAGPPEGGLSLLEETMKLAAASLRLPFDSLLLPSAPDDPETMEQDAELKERAAAFGRRLAGA